jgi:RNA polymerase sigma-70 factor (sigma-E family)
MRPPRLMPTGENASAVARAPGVPATSDVVGAPGAADAPAGGADDVPRAAVATVRDTGADGHPLAGGVAVDKEAALAELFAAHYTPMLRLAVLLGADDAEDVVAEAFWQLYRRWNRLRTAEAAVGYLRSVVVNLVRMRIRHLQVVRKHAEQINDGVESAEHEALLREDQRELVAALKTLPGRQREALVLRYWLGLREAEIAEAMGISCGAVKSHTARAMATLTRVMGARA